MSTSMVNLIRNTLKVLTESNKFDRVLNKVQIVSASNGRLTAEMEVTEESLNWSDSLHGGMTATLVDQLSSLALTTALVKEEDLKTETNFAKVKSVSLDLSISYLNGVKKGETLLIEAKTLKFGKTIAFLCVDIFNKQTNQLVVTGKHTKYLLKN